MIRIGVIGYGYWGPHIVRNFQALDGSQVVLVCDKDPASLGRAKQAYPNVEVTPDCSRVLTSAEIDAVAVITPVWTHFELARTALQNGKHVFVEKPFTSTVAQAEELIDLAERNNLKIMVDHTFLFTGAVRKIRQLIDEDTLGELYYYDSMRVNLGLFQHDVNVLWDLAVHDLSIMDYLLPAQPCAVSATGMSHVPGEPENIAYVTLFFDCSMIAHINVNWLAPAKVRRTLICGSQRMVLYDDLEPSEKVKVYNRGISVNKTPESVYQILIDYRTGDMWAPQLELTEALRTEALHFLRCIEAGEVPVTDARAGLRVIRILEAATRSLSARGRQVEIR